jgi:hypothetical protein
MVDNRGRSETIVVSVIKHASCEITSPIEATGSNPMRSIRWDVFTSLRFLRWWRFVFCVDFWDNTGDHNMEMNWLIDKRRPYNPGCPEVQIFRFKFLLIHICNISHINLSPPTSPEPPAPSKILLLDPSRLYPVQPPQSVSKHVCRMFVSNVWPLGYSSFLISVHLSFS